MDKTIQREPNLRIPGPVALADDVREAMAQQTVDHRSADYADVLDRTTMYARECLKTTGDLYFITSSGTGGMEAAVVNTLSPGDKVLCVSVGWFGDRFNDIAEGYGLDVELMRYEGGMAADPDEVRAKLRGMKGCKAVMLVHNESSTGICNPLRELCEAVRAESDALLLADCISSAGGLELEVDAWGVDVSIAAAQKSFEAPAGMAIITFSKRAWAAYEASKLPKYYFDMGHYRRYLERLQPPFTPCLSSMFALEHSLERISAEGVETSIARHRAMGEMVRDGVRSIGLSLLAHDERHASNTLTAVKLPDGVDGKAVVTRLRDDHDVQMGGGLGELAGKMVRIGHMGRVSHSELNSALEALSRTLDADR